METGETEKSAPLELLPISDPPEADVNQYIESLAELAFRFE